MSSGVNVHADCQSKFQQLSEGKRTLRYIIYKIDDKDVVVEAAVSPDEVRFLEGFLKTDLGVARFKFNNWFYFYFRLA